MKKRTFNVRSGNFENAFHNIRNSSKVLLQEYFGIDIKNIPIFCKSIYSNYGTYSIFDGKQIIIDPIFYSLGEQKKIFILAHEIAHFYQWKQLSNPQKRNVVLNFLMEIEANSCALDYIKQTCAHVDVPRKRFESWNLIEEITNSIPQIPTYSHQFSAFGIGGVFALKQALVSKKSTNKGMVVQYEGCHETLTREALFYAQEEGMSTQNHIDKESLIYGSIVNDMYFAFDLQPLYKNELTDDSKRLLDELDKKLEQIKKDKGGYPQDGLNLIDVSKFTTAESITSSYAYLTLLLSIATTGSATGTLIEGYNDKINNILAHLFNSDLLFLKKVQDFIKENTSHHIFNFLEKIQNFLPVEYVLNLGGGFIEWAGDWWNSSSAILECAEKKIDLYSANVQVDISKGFFSIDTLRAIYCCAQFLISSHTGDLQFLHSMECSEGEKEKNKKKCIRFAKFCVDVYLNKNNILEEKFGDYVSNLPDEDILKDMLCSLIIPISASSVIEYKSKNKELSENAKKYANFFDGMIENAKNIINYFDGSTEKKDENQPEITGNKIEQIISTYKQGKESFFAKFTVGDFFTMGQTKYKHQSIALGMACHMIEDSFTASHTIRAFNLYNEVPSTKTDFLNNIPPIIYYADYTKQDANQHMNADVFVVDLDYGKEGLCKLCDAEINEIRDNPYLDIEQGICDIQNHSSQSDDFYKNPAVVQFFNSNQENHFIHSTLGAELAKKCAGHFLKLVTDLEKGEINENELDQFLNVVYADIDQKNYQNIFPFLDKKENAKRAGRNYELNELETKEFFERLSSNVKEWSFTNIMLSPEDISDNFEKMGEEFNELNSLGKKFENAVEEYRVYLDKCFSTSNRLTKEPFEIKKKVEEEMSRRQDERKDIYQKIIGSQPSYSSKWLYKSLAERLVILYSKFDLVYLEYILKLIAKSKKKISNILDSVSQKSSKSIKLSNEQKKRLLSYNQMLSLSQSRYSGHLYEIAINLIWMKEQLDNLKKIDKKANNKDFNETTIDLVCAKINSLQVFLSPDVDESLLQIEYYTEALQDAISTIVDGEKNRFIFNLLTEEKHNHTDEEIASLAEVPIELVQKLRKSLSDKNQSGSQTDVSNPKIPIEAGKNDSNSGDIAQKTPSSTGSLVKEIYNKYKQHPSIQLNDFMNSLGYKNLSDLQIQNISKLIQ